MADLTPPELDPAQGERLVRADYWRDFDERKAEIDNRDSLKLERLQHFDEQDDPSRDALRRGEWEEALRLLEADRAEWTAAAEDFARFGSVFRRVRIVEEPLTSYMQWELHLLRLADECGVRARVLTADALGGAEADGLLPELVILGGRTMYLVRYTGSGVPDGALRFTDPQTVQRWDRYLRRLNEAGEDVQTYFERRVAHLPPPVPA